MGYDRGGSRGSLSIPLDSDAPVVETLSGTPSKVSMKTKKGNVFTGQYKPAWGMGICSECPLVCLMAEREDLS